MASSIASCETVDVLIAGAGIVGLALAVALRQALGASFSVTVADPALARPRAMRARPRSLRRRGGCSRQSACGT